MNWTKLNEIWIQKHFFLQENAFESVFCKMSAILLRPQCATKCQSWIAGVTAVIEYDTGLIIVLLWCHTRGSQTKVYVAVFCPLRSLFLWVMKKEFTSPKTNDLQMSWLFEVEPWTPGFEKKHKTCLWIPMFNSNSFYLHFRFHSFNLKGCVSLVLNELMMNFLCSLAVLPAACPGPSHPCLPTRPRHA